ncbi:abortive infection family protein [Moritella viscosa]|uniref:abortive infection family protein n=1 Tax=Moritella viscosa TaxID=80854 RepID=UPI00092238B0|nr:abortive infection family protein [Moritella viscosa]SGY89618.1 Putative uncharacterized protein [Moritella viscosa]
MNALIPNSVIGSVASIIAAHYYSHTKLESLFMEAGAPGDTPQGNCETKCSSWLKRCNEDDSVEALEVLGGVIQKYMDNDSFCGNDLEAGQERISSALAKNNLVYRVNGHVIPAGSNSITKTLEDFFKTGDFSSIEKEFERAVLNISSDPHASITAACSIIESALKFYIEKFELGMPRKLNVIDLWGVVRIDLSLNSDPALAADQHKILKGLSAIIDGVGAFRSHIGSAHGRGQTPPSIVQAEARLAVNASHTVVVFVMEHLHAKSA